MPYSVLKSKIIGLFPDFDTRVSNFLVELNLWVDREKIIAEENKTPLPSQPEWADYSNKPNAASEFWTAMKTWEEDKGSRHGRVPRPTADMNVASAVRFDGSKYVADYEIVNDDPTSDQILRVKKNALLQAMATIETNELDKIALPAGKRRLAFFRHRDITLADDARYQAMVKQFVDNNAAIAAAQKETPRDEAHIKDLMDIVSKLSVHVSNADGFHDGKRPQEDQKFLNEQKQREAKSDAIARWAAQVQSDIEDLTEENIDNWKIPQFEG